MQIIYNFDKKALRSVKFYKCVLIEKTCIIQVTKYMLFLMRSP